MTETVERMLPLYEAKMIHQFDHRWATYDSDATRSLNSEERSDPTVAVLPRYWVAAGSVDPVLNDDEGSAWRFGWRDIARSTDERTLIASPFPASGVGNNLPLILNMEGSAGVLSACLNSLIVDFLARLKTGGVHLNYFVTRQLAVLRPSVFAEQCKWAPQTTSDWITPRVLELTYTAWDMQPFADDLGDTGAPFVWDPERRFLLRAELDAAFFHLYGVSRDDADYILDTFPIVRRKDEEAHGEYRTKRVVLEIFDAMQRAADTGTAYDSILNPAPGFGPRHPEQTA